MLRLGWKVLTLGAVASLGLSACGASVQSTLKGAMASVGAQQYLQVHLTASATATGASSAQATKVEKVLSLLSYDITEQSTSGTALSKSAGKINEEITISVGSQKLVDVIEIGTDIYAKVDFTSLAQIPSVGVSSAQTAGLQLLLGARWFELPSSLLNNYLPSKAQVKSQTARQHAVEQKVVDALTALIDKTKYTTLSGGGYQEKGTLQSVADALAPVMAGITSTPVHNGKVPGTYQVGISLSGSTATGADIAITAPNGTSGDMTVQVAATIAHQSDSINAPSGATVITPQLIASLSGRASGSGLGLG